MRTSVKFTSILATGILLLPMSNISLAAQGLPTSPQANSSVILQGAPVVLKATVDSMSVAIGIARSTYLKAIAEAKAGRDRALADSKASLQQDLITAGKDKNAQKIAYGTATSNSNLIWNSYHQAIALALETYKRSLASLPKK